MSVFGVLLMLIGAGAFVFGGVIGVGDMKVAHLPTIMLSMTLFISGSIFTVAGAMLDMVMPALDVLVPPERRKPRWAPKQQPTGPSSAKSRRQADVERLTKIDWTQ